MRYRLLGRTGLRVSELFLGAMTFGRPEGPDGMGLSLADCREILDVYADHGGNVVDTAVNYRGGASEEFLGELLAGRRDRFVVASKYTVSRDGTDPNAAGNHRKNLTRSLDTSLRRLRTDYLDVYWIHLWDRHTPVEETMRALDDAVTAGKVLHIGMSNTPAWVVATAHTLAGCRGWSPLAAIQVPYSLLNRDIERELLPMAEARGMTVAAWSPLGGGILSGKYTTTAANGGRRQSRSEGSSDSGRPRAPGRFDSDLLGKRETAVVRAAMEVADVLGVTPAQVALAWTRARSYAVHPIVGARTVDQLTENLGALDVELPSEALLALDRATGFRRGYPADFIAETSAGAFGEVSSRVDGRPTQADGP
ncbi:aldo/keto reductase [Streptomyces sp. NL15-2K]|uniref:aldo/keto reductase n=1 Tax=Streptomyces sp. NL15-2K TaxID=376149 RepID=UPI000F57E92A|nr:MULTISPECIES: aldo/keto reductase [Actinomycetes]WKX09533.1 aldo/keto reductase [Kutzneria buriramensis]GCB48954.1 hypothetical protein SNL152K_6284 [Streptomyces sp. NL15-2K]